MTVNTMQFYTVRDAIDCAADSWGDTIFLNDPLNERNLTYAAFRAAAIGLYARFRRLGLEAGDKIALLSDNGLVAIELFLGAMYGGFAAVPLNVRAGVAQLAYTLDHCDAKVVFVGANYRELIASVLKEVARPLQVILLEGDAWPGDEGQPAVELAPLSPEDTALLMYTSGSTGLPKGAVHSHRSVLAHGRHSIAAHHLTAADRALLVLPLYHINAECVTLIPTLLSGGSVVVPPGFQVNAFWDWLADYGCSWAAIVPTIVSQLLDWQDPKAAQRGPMFARLRFLRSSSGPLSPALHREFLQKFPVPLIQGMGSSEAGNVFANPLPPSANKIGSTGLPWLFDAKIVDSAGEELPSTVPGEVLLRGAGLMQGYYKDPAATAAALDSDGWMHTGDLAYRDANGYFFVVGRAKELIIKGGVNIAPRQVDEALESHPAVLEAAAVGVPDRYLGEDVVGFAVLRDGAQCTEQELLAFCETRLGAFKTPTRVHFVSELPKGPSGKVQRLRLVEDADSFISETAVVRRSDAASDAARALEQPLEDVIARNWADLLQRPQIDHDANFFALGGQSLLAIQSLSRLRDQISVIVSLPDFFKHPTVAGQAALIRERLASGNSATCDRDLILPRDRSQPCPLSPAQERLWFLEQLIAGEPVYNEAEAVRLKGPLDFARFEAAFNAVVARHEILRATIRVEGGHPTAVIHESWPIDLRLIDLSDLEATEREAELTRLLVAEPRRPYDLEKRPGIRALVIRLSADEHVFILMMHHIICDRLSVGILWSELSALYASAFGESASALPALSIHYGDYAVWQRRPQRQQRFVEDLSFWTEYLQGAPALLELPTDRPRPSVNTYRGNKIQFRIGPELSADLRRLSQLERTSLFSVFATALNVLLYRYSDQEDILLGIPIADRDRTELQPLIGFLLDTHVLRTDLGEVPTFRELLNRVQQGLLGVYSHQAVPFHEVVNALRPKRSLSYAPLFQVMLNWRDADAELAFIGFPDLTVEPLLAQCKISKFDLTFLVTDAPDDIYLEIEFNTDLFDDDRITRMVGHLCTLLRGAVDDPERPVAELPLLTPEEQHQLLVEWNTVPTEQADA